MRRNRTSAPITFTPFHTVKARNKTLGGNTSKHHKNFEQGNMLYPSAYTDDGCYFWWTLFAAFKVRIKIEILKITYASITSYRSGKQLSWMKI